MEDTEDHGRGPFDTERGTGRDLLQGIAKESVRAKLFGETATQLLGDRYRIVKRIGSGGMGAVYLAIDTRLERHVAIKVLQPGASDQERPRLVREALLMARVPSVHVVPVHDVGHDAGQAFVAMEYVPGPNLRQWLEEKRSWREVLNVMIEAGRGLAAAHAAGVVHRDFKPDNVLIDGDGRARVVDFGLASVGAVEIEASTDRTLSFDGSTLTTLTRTGEVVGTPRYMAPEQFTASAPGEAADQFALCVTLYEGLYGQRPFEGETMAALAENVLVGHVREPPSLSDVPGWLWPVVRRGLAPEPRDRHPSVAALLVALQRDPVSRRRRVIAGVGLLAVGGLGATAVWAFASRGSSDEVCVLAEDRFADVWDDPVRTSVQGAFELSKRAHAKDTFERVVSGLDAWSTAWRSQWSDACEAAANKEQSETVLDLRMACLERARMSLQAATRLLREPPDPSVIDHSLEVVAALPRLDRCADVEGLMAAYPPPDAEEDRVEADAIGAAIADVKALRDAGAYEAAHTQLGPLLERARTLAYPPLLADALLLDGSLRRSTETEAAAEPVLREAAAVAAEARADVIVSKAWLRLMSVARARGEYDKARELAAVTEIAIARAGSPAELVGSLGNERGILARVTADYPTAGEQFEIARQRWIEVYGEESADVAAATLNLGTVAEETGNVDEAAKLYTQALAMFERVLGPQHPRLSPALSRLGALEEERGRFDEARAYYQRVLAIDTATHGAEHEEVAYTLVDLGTLAHRESRCDEAAEYYERARAIWVRAHGPEHPNLVAVDGNLANCLQDERDYAGARALYQRALELAERTLGPDHPQVAALVSNLGVVAEAEGKHAEARAYHERALALRRAKLGADHPETINSIRNLAFVAAHEGKWAEARTLYEQALDSLVAVWGRDHPDVAVTHRELARIAAATHEKAEAKAHYGHAIAIYKAMNRPDDARELEAELAAL